MAELKTKVTEQTVEAFLSQVPDESVRKDCSTLVKLFKKVTGSVPKMWGPSIVGFGKYHYKYDSGHEGEICLTGFSPRKQNLSLYVLGGFPGQDELLKKLGKHKAGKGCLYVKKLEDIDTEVLEEMVKRCISYTKKKFPDQ